MLSSAKVRARSHKSCLTRPDAARARFNFEMDRGLTDIDQALERMLEVQATIGAKGNALFAQRSINEDLSVQLEKARSNLEDVDPVRAISDLARHSQALEAAQQVAIVLCHRRHAELACRTQRVHDEVLGVAGVRCV